MFFTVLFLLLLTVGGWAQSIRFSEVYNHPNEGSGILEDIVVMDNGNLMVIGNSLNFNTGLRDAHHLVIDNQGAFVNEVSLETDSFEINPQAIIRSNYSSALYSSGYWCNYLSTSPGPCDFYISKLDESGDTLFTRIIERPDTSDFLLNMVETRPNKIMLIGWTYNDTVDVDADLLFVTVDTLGNELNRIVFGGGGTDFVSDGLVIDSTGDVIMVGFTKSFPTLNSGRSWVLKTDSIGNIKWHRTYSGIGASTANGIRLSRLPDNNVVIAGGKSGNGYLQKIDTMGNEIWAIEYNVGGTQGLWSCAGLADGTIVANGVTDATDGSQAGWFVKTDENGDTLWTRTYNPSDNTDFLRNMLLMPNGDIVMVGFGRGENSTTQDGWILRVDSMGCLQEGCFSVGIDELEQGELSITAYPNPATDAVQFRVGDSSARSSVGMTVRVLDAVGRVLRYTTLTRGTQDDHAVDISALPTGIYFLELTNTEGRKAVRKFVKE